jgi:hypothetical protein
MATRRASLGHRDLATRPGAGLLDGLARSRVVRPNQFEPVALIMLGRKTDGTPDRRKVTATTRAMSSAD